MGWEEPTDMMLVKKIKEGDEYSFEVMLKRYDPLIVKIAHKFYLYGYEVDDFKQISSLAFYDAILNFDESCEFAFYAYALKAMRNRMMSLCRKELVKDEKGTEHDEISVVMEARENYIVFQSEIVDEANDLEIHKYRVLLKELLSETSFLSPFERICLEGAISGLPQATVAQINNADLKKVNNAWLRIREKLRKRGFESIS